jgi:hypothetical protein
MHLVYEIHREEYFQAARVQGGQLANPWLPRAVPYAACALGFLLLLKRDEMPTWGAPALLICMGAVLAIHGVWGAYAAAEKGWGETKRKWRRTQLHTTSERLRFVTDVSDSSYRWEVFDHFGESRDLFLLYQTRSQISYFIPKRCFSSRADVDEFRALLAERIRHRRVSSHLQS